MVTLAIEDSVTSAPVRFLQLISRPIPFQGNPTAFTYTKQTPAIKPIASADEISVSGNIDL